jgi:hypothetical protein
VADEATPKETTMAAVDWVQVRHPETKGTAKISRKALPSYEGRGWVEVDDTPEGKYETMSKAELVDEIDKRNEQRPADSHLPRTGNKGDLIATLVGSDTPSGSDESSSPE